MEEQGLVVVKDNFLVRLTDSIKRFFFKGKIKDYIVEDEESGIKYIKKDTSFVQKEILDARRAFRKYVINNNKNITKDVLLYVGEKVRENQKRIKQIIAINGDDISYNDILSMLEKERKTINKYKTRNKKTGYYNVPIGVVGVECDNVKDSIESIFKAISTRNAIIVLHKNYNEYSTESLIMLIVKECLKNFYIDDNIVQMFEKEEIDLKKLDKFITKDGKSTIKNTSNTIYIYQENDEFANDVQDEITRLKNTEMYKSYQIEPIKGDFGNIINYLNNKNASAVCMYTSNTQRAYKFINWINSPNVFVNTGIKNCMEAEGEDNKFFNSKYIMHEDVF